MHCLLLALTATAFELNYQQIAVTAPRRVVSAADVDAKFDEVNRPYALVGVEGPAALGLCVFADVAFSAPGFEWRRENYLVELLDDQAEPFGLVSTQLADAAVVDGASHDFDFDVDLNLRSALSPEFGDLEKGATCACSVAVKRVLEKRPDPRTDDEKKAIIGERLRARAAADGEAAANAEIRGFLRRETGEDWAHISVAIADRENIDLGDVPAFLRERTTVTWRDA